MTHPSPTPTILLTGGSRGVGAATVTALCARGATVVFTYREKAARAEAVIAGIAAGRAVAVQADLTVPADRARLIERTRAVTPVLSGLVLNASGGLEKERLAVDPDFPLHLNRDAQLALLDAALPLLAPGGVIVFVTSHWAHFYGQQPVPPVYDAVARGKHAGEAALRARLPELETRGLRLAVVSGDVIEGTITPRLLERASPGLMANRRADAGQLPTVDDMAAAIVQALSDESLTTGATLYVGSTVP
jgi:NAD(P)-dependent dehydrogenase (short-subunit alcohol dehydrogenase family)